MTANRQTLTVELGVRSYPIHIGAGVLRDSSLYRTLIPARATVLVTSESVGKLYAGRLRQALGDCAIEAIALTDGEASKTMANVEHILDRMLRAGAGRDCTVLALGGGVVGDIAGFAAAIYQRGVDFLQLPTTLLAQVDSSVGGKTGVNHPLGKNMIGAFHQPRAVLADTDTLETLPGRELKAGIAEIIKYGLLGDADFFDWLETHMDELLARKPGALVHAIKRSCENKAAIVAADEREAGQRALMNLGHTFGHAIETGAGYGAWLHGEAVAAGMCMAADMSRRLDWLSPADYERAVALIGRAGLPTSPPAGLPPERFLELMRHDKKARAGRLRLILMRGIGHAVLSADFPQETLTATLRAWLK